MIHAIFASFCVLRIHEFNPAILMRSSMSYVNSFQVKQDLYRTCLILCYSQQ